MKVYKFFDEIHDFQRFVRENIFLIGNYTIISEQLTIKNNETSIIDILAVDNEDKRLAILELKNTLTTDKNVWQPIRYYDLIRRGENDIKELLFKASNKIEYDIDLINLDPKVILIVPQSNEQLLRTLSHFNEIDSQIVEIRRFRTNNSIEIKKQIFYPTSIFHKEDTTEIKQKVSTNWNFDEYLKKGINKEKIQIAKSTLNQIKLAFEHKNLKFDVFFTETKITITRNGKVWGYLFIKQNPLNYKLTISFKINKDVVVNKNNFIYEPHIESVDIKTSNIKLLVSNPISFRLFEKYL